MRGPGAGAQPLASPLVIRAGRIIIMACALWVGFSLLMSTNLVAPYSSRTSLEPNVRRSKPPKRPKCDPLSTPGYLSDTPGTVGIPNSPGPLAMWNTFNPSCRPLGSSGLWALLLSHYPKSPYYGSLTESSTGKAVTELTAHSLSHNGGRSLKAAAQNRTVLLVGDHSDGSLVHQTCSLAGESAQAVTGFHPWAKGIDLRSRGDNSRRSSDFRDRGNRPPPKESFHTTHHLADYCYLPVDDLLLVSVYHFGVQPSSSFGSWNHGGVVWGPSDFEERVEKLFVPLFKHLADHGIYSSLLPPARKAKDPDLIVFQTGIWDLARRAEDAVHAHADINKAGDEKYLLDWRARGIDMLHSLSKAFPSSTLAWRTVPHIPEGPDATLGRLLRRTHAYLGGNSPGTPAMSAIDETKALAPLQMARVAALNAAVRSVFEDASKSLMRGMRDRTKSGLPKGTQFIPWADLVRAHTDLLADPLTLASYPSASLFAEVLLQTLYYI